MRLADRPASIKLSRVRLAQPTTLSAGKPKLDVCKCPDRVACAEDVTDKTTISPRGAPRVYENRSLDLSTAVGLEFLRSIATAASVQWKQPRRHADLLTFLVADGMVYYGATLCNDACGVMSRSTIRRYTNSTSHGNY